MVFWKALKAMRTLNGAMDSLADTIEPALAYVRERLVAGRGKTARGDIDFDEVLVALTAVKLYLDIFRPPEYTACNPSEWLQSHGQEIGNERCSILGEATSPATVDSAQAWACVTTLIDNVALYEDAVLVADVFEEEGVPRITLSLDGPGTFPARLLVGGLLPIEYETLCERWTVATRGGKIQRTPSGLELRLKGMREPGPSDEGIEPLAERWAKLYAEVEACIRAQDSSQDLERPLNAAMEVLEDFLGLVDGEIRIEPAAIPATLKEAIAVHAREAAERSVGINEFVEREIPPIAVARRVIVRVWSAIVQHAFRVLPRGGRVSFIVDYDDRARRITVMIEIEGTQCVPRETLYLASIRRGIREVHGGEVEFTGEKNGVLMTLSLPDGVGETLDSWLPGWDRFSGQSRQMLRLLKGGGQMLPEEFLLGGILENELERWLLPLLTEPRVVNIVHDGVANLEGLPDGSPERLDKALNQIKRGKPKKEIVRPPYAGELLWVFREPERSRKALRLDRLDHEALRDLCSGLVQSPVESVRCLRHVARVAEEE